MTKSGQLGRLNGPPSLREAYNQCRARLGLAINPDMPIEFSDSRNGWVTSDGLLYLTAEAAARVQAELDLQVENSTLIERGKEGLRRLRKRMEKTTLSQAPVPARPFVAPGTYAREVDESLLREGGVDYESGQFSFQPNRFSTASTERLYTTYQPPVVDVSSALPREELRERVQRLQRKLSGKVEPEAVELYTQSVESKRRVKLKPRGGA